MALTPRQQILFNPGPVNLDDEIKSRLFDVELCHRQPEFEALHDRTKERLGALLGFPRSRFNLALMHGSGTLAVDAGLTSLVRGRVLVIDNGLYCDRLARTLARAPGVDVVRLELGIGVPVDLAQLADEADDAQPDWIALVHHETTTGLLNPLPELTSIAAGLGARLFVDAVSSLGAHAVDSRADVVCFNSSKCLESLPGIAGVFFRPDLATYETVPVLDVNAYADAMPSTPNVQAFLALDIALDIFEREDRPARYERLAHHVWKAGQPDFTPLLPAEHRSNVLTSFELEGRSIEDLFDRALHHGMVIYPGQLHLRDRIFRIANMGAAMNEQVIDELFEVLAS
jgi:2-aminoethylphosphonate-pyruvate transaminase